LCAVTRITMRQAMDMPHTRAMARRLVREALEVGRAMGHPFDDDALRTAMSYLALGGDHRPSMAVDLLHGSPTEIEFINGKMVELAGRFPHLAVDANRFVTSLVITEEVRNGSRRPDRIPPYLCD
jgi:2-dehydropantoate 2-reductase